MKAANWIDKVKAERGWESDYRVAKELGLSKQTIGSYRGKVVTMDESTAIKVAEALGVDPAGVLIDQLAERSKDEALSATLHKVARQLCILCKVASAVVKKSRISGPTLNCPGFPLQFPPSNLATA